MQTKFDLKGRKEIQNRFISNVEIDKNKGSLSNEI